MPPTARRENYAPHVVGIIHREEDLETVIEHLCTLPGRTVGVMLPPSYTRVLHEIPHLENFWHPLISRLRAEGRRVVFLATPHGFRMRLKERSRALREDGQAAHYLAGLSGGLFSPLEDGIVKHALTKQFMRLARDKRPGIIVGEIAPAHALHKRWQLPHENFALPGVKRGEVAEIARQLLAMDKIAEIRERRVHGKKTKGEK